jgi:hypothetical protein
MTQTPDKTYPDDGTTYVYATTVVRYTAACNRCAWTEEHSHEQEARLSSAGHASYHRAAAELKAKRTPAKDGARLDGEGRLTVQHVTNGRDHDGVEWSLCGVRVPDDAQPAPADAPVCTTCNLLDA